MDEFDLMEEELMRRFPQEQEQELPVFPMAPPAPMQLFPLTPGQEFPLAQTPPAEPLLQRRIAGLPVWGWGVGLAAAGGLWWYFNNKRESVTPNEGDSSSGGDVPALPAGWRPSRSAFGDRLRGFLQKNGISDKTQVWTDADEAQKKLKQVSPLVTIQCKAPKVPVKELDKFAKREGLSAVEHGEGVVGFYPGGGKKGKAWEEYIDALRDEGQQV